MNRPLTSLCSVHSSRRTQPGTCVDCQQQQQLAICVRRIRELETQIERLEGRLVALEPMTADTQRTKA